jgi:hypothetical protein
MARAEELEEVVPGADESEPRYRLTEAGIRRVESLMARPVEGGDDG